jgi:hypothetical protein
MVKVFKLCINLRRNKNERPTLQKLIKIKLVSNKTTATIKKEQTFDSNILLKKSNRKFRLKKGRRGGKTIIQILEKIT